MTRAQLDPVQTLDVLVAAGEAVANAIEHGHRDRPEGKICLGATVLVVDDGAGPCLLMPRVPGYVTRPSCLTVVLVAPATDRYAADVVQPDLHYGGGFIRATQVARMAAAAGLPVVPHMSGGGLGYLEVVHFASFTPNIGLFMEFKGNTDLPVACATSPLKCQDGQVRCPTGVGFGVTIDAAFVKRAQPV